MDMAPNTIGKVAYFAPDLADPAVHRRVNQWRHAGHEVYAFAFAREATPSDLPGYVSLGRLTHQSRLTRVLALGRALARLWNWRDSLAQADLYVARNLDNALLALFVRKMIGARLPVVYEVLDINTSCIGNGLFPRIMRQVERWLLSRVNLLVVSSPCYISSYYTPFFNFNAPWLLFENKVPRHACPSRKLVDESPRSDSWKIGWFGFLDDERGWRALYRLAETLPEQVMIYVRGRPYSDFDHEKFLDDVARLGNVVYGGPYRSPDDLSAIYEAVDIVWSVDLNDMDGNSRWLLTNATYEALYFGKPIISMSGTAVGDFITEYKAGWCLGDHLEEELITLFARLSEEQYAETRAAIANIPRNRFVESDEIEQIYRLVCTDTTLETKAKPGAVKTTRLRDLVKL